MCGVSTTDYLHKNIAQCYNTHPMEQLMLLDVLRQVCGLDCSSVNHDKERCVALVIVVMILTIDQETVFSSG
jgi:hypothetical protein